MTLRQWYAGLAMAHLSDGYNQWDAASLAVQHADALLAELAKEAT